MKDIKNNESDICKKCGGLCCKHMGCHISPRDIGENITKEDITKLLDTGYVSIDWWNGDPTEDFNMTNMFFNAYYLRMRNKGEPIVYGSFGGECMALTENGCKVDFEHRPLGGQMLIPNPTTMGGCPVEYSKQDCAIEWLQYHDMLEEIAREYLEPGQMIW